MKQYLELLEYVLFHGEKKLDRTKTGTISFFGLQKRYNLKNEFPLVTTKKIFWKAIVHELLWMIKGDTNIKYLVDNGVNIWNDWPYEIYKKGPDYQGETLKEFVLKIKTNPTFAKKHGNLGPVYGQQWRNFNGVDQLKKLLLDLKNHPFSRRHIISAWNPGLVDEMALPPCHALFQFYVHNDHSLSCHLYQRSADLFLGVPFNIASYSLLTYLIAYYLNLKPNTFIHALGDAHIYLNHVTAVKTQLKRQPFKAPQIKLINMPETIFDVKFENIILENYFFHPLIKGDISV